MSGSLYRFLNLRRNNKIQHPHIRQLMNHLRDSSTSCANCDGGRVQSLMWINMALRFNMVEVLDLELFTSPFCKIPFEFPSSILECGSLRSLSMRMIKTIMKAPSSACSSNLECLNLKYVAIDKGFFKWISSSCKCIKEIRLEHLPRSREVITIESSSLESFSILSRRKELCDLIISGEKLQDISILNKLQYELPLLYYENSPSGIVNICAPNLKFLEWFGYPENHQQLGKFLCLEKAEICLSCEEKNFDKVLEVLRSICRVKVLTLHKPTIKALINGGLFFPQPFEDVSYLKINIGNFTDDLVQAMVSLFRGMSNWTTLYIKFSRDAEAVGSQECSGADMGYWKSQNVPFISELKEVTIEILSLYCFGNGSNPIEFSRFILKHAHNLKKMVIVCPYQWRKWAVNEFCTRERASNATVVYREASNSTSTS